MNYLLFLILILGGIIVGWTARTYQFKADQECFNPNHPKP